MGVFWVSADGSVGQDYVNVAELGIMLGSTVAMTATVWCQPLWSRLLGPSWNVYMGGLMLLGYIAFLVLEFTVIRSVRSE